MTIYGHCNCRAIVSQMKPIIKKSLGSWLSDSNLGHMMILAIGGPELRDVDLDAL